MQLWHNCMHIYLQEFRELEGKGKSSKICSKSGIFTTNAMDKLERFYPVLANWKGDNLELKTLNCMLASFTNSIQKPCIICTSSADDFITGKKCEKRDFDELKKIIQTQDSNLLKKHSIQSFIQVLRCLLN